ncbi:hypothetical protein BJF85_20495 [Saccharomonospora sp. CUA-673]|nr:hypothetical protein BJF85_20495 [Saccharomonospora sp. CUA-673]
MGETTVEERPQKVAALDSSYADAAASLETEVVAYTKYPSSDGLPDYLGEDKQYLEGAKDVGALESPNVEALYDVQPDLIVSAKVRHEAIHSKLSNVAPTVFSESTGATWKDNIRLLAEALGKEDLAERKIGEYEERAKAIGDAIEQKEGSMPTYSLVRFMEGEQTVRLYASNSFPAIVMNDVGLKRPEGQPDSKDEINVDVSQEDIAKLDADEVFVSSYADATQQAEDPRKRFESNPLWGKLSGELADVDDETWYVSVSLQGAHAMLDDIAEKYGVDPAKPDASPVRTQGGGVEAVDVEVVVGSGSRFGGCRRLGRNRPGSHNSGPAALRREPFGTAALELLRRQAVVVVLGARGRGHPGDLLDERGHVLAQQQGDLVVAVLRGLLHRHLRDLDDQRAEPVGAPPRRVRGERQPQQFPARVDGEFHRVVEVVRGPGGLGHDLVDPGQRLLPRAGTVDEFPRGLVDRLLLHASPAPDDRPVHIARPVGLVLRVLRQRLVAERGEMLLPLRAQCGRHRAVHAVARPARRGVGELHDLTRHVVHPGVERHR